MKTKTVNLVTPQLIARFAIVVAALATVFVCEPQRVAANEPELKRFSYVQLQMAMPMRITVWTESETQAESACKLAFTHATELVNIFSDYNRHSEAMLLTRYKVGSNVPISEHLLSVLSFSQELHRESAGAFDVTARPIIELWRRARKDGVLPNSEQLRSAIKRAGPDQIQLNAQTKSATLLADNVELDFGGIAKGYIGDQVIRVLKENGIAICCYEAGGDIVLGDAPPNTEGWTIDIGKNQDSSARTRVLKNCAISTSGDTQQFVEIAGIRYSHVLDPRTGIGITTGRAAFVIASSGMQSDALATVGCILDEPAFQAVLRKYKNTTGWSEANPFNTNKSKISLPNVSR